ncbi:hypothetical protein EDC04DRAFT_2066621 [Pisolithus marmoratus]|nr:hypothetical protein EDC04DRAFT_2066621 [Pisolithus marmoratus]
MEYGEAQKWEESCYSSLLGSAMQARFAHYLHSQHIALLFFGQVFGAISRPVFQVLAPMFSERWFDLRSRTTATMAIAIAGPVGSALSQFLSPLVSTVRQSVS